MAEQPTATAVALQLDTSATLIRFTRAIDKNSASVTTLHFYEHRNNSFSLHGTEQVRQAIALSANARQKLELSAPSSDPTAAPLDTLILNARDASALAAHALFSAGRKVVVWAVAADGRISSRMEGTPGCPGHNLSAWLGDNRPDDGVVLAVRPTTRAGSPVLGLAVWDPAAVCLRATDLLDGDALAALETVFVATNARELLVPDDVQQFDRQKLDILTERANIALTVRKRKSFDPADVADVVHRLAGSRHVENAILHGKLPAAGALAALIDYLGLGKDPELEGKISLRELEIAGTMKLDGAVMRALNILPFPGDGGRNASLFGLLNRGRSAMGSRLLRRWLSQPLQDIDAINERLDVVEALVNSPETQGCIRDDHISKMPDLNVLCKRFTRDNGSKAKLEDVVRLYQCSVRLPALCADLERDGAESILSKRYGQPLRKLVLELRNFESLVETTIDLDQIDNREYVVNPKVDPELKELRERQDKVLAQINREFGDTASAIPGLKHDSLKLERKDNIGYIFRLTRKEEKLIRGNNEYPILETRKDGVRFQTRKLRRYSETYESIAHEYRDKEASMRAKTLEVVGTYVEVFIDVSAILAEVDVLCSFGVVANESRAAYVRPTIIPAGSGLLLRDARHPIVEENLSDGAEFISNTIDLRRESARKKDGDGDYSMEDASEGTEGEGAKGDETAQSGGSVVLVTGPNMGGKSTFIRSAGVLTLMAHVGCFVPAAEARVPLTDRIFARVGAGDNQHRALSTFMSEMVETALILRSATWKSLVIIDELGRGTGTTDGFGLAHAIGKHIATQVRCGCLFATHFYELTALADDVADVRNAHVSAVAEPGGRGLTFLYEVRDGACDQSFGVHVAEMAMFPESVVNVAKRKADELEGCTTVSRRMREAKIDDDEVEVGRKLLIEFQSDIAKLPCADEEQVQASENRARELREALLAHNNRYISSLIAG